MSADERREYIYESWKSFQRWLITESRLNYFSIYELNLSYPFAEGCRSLWWLYFPSFYNYFLGDFQFFFECLIFSLGLSELEILFFSLLLFFFSPFLKASCFIQATSTLFGSLRASSSSLSNFLLRFETRLFVSSCSFFFYKSSIETRETLESRIDWEHSASSSSILDMILDYFKFNKSSTSIYTSQFSLKAFWVSFLSEGEEEGGASYFFPLANATLLSLIFSGSAKSPFLGSQFIIGGLGFISVTFVLFFSCDDRKDQLGVNFDTQTPDFIMLSFKANLEGDADGSFLSLLWLLNNLLKNPEPFFRAYSSLAHSAFNLSSSTLILENSIFLSWRQIMKRSLIYSTHCTSKSKSSSQIWLLQIGH